MTRLASWALLDDVEHIDANIIAHTILATPDVIRMSLAAHGDLQRQNAAAELARAIVDQICPRRNEPDPDQFGLAL